MAKTLANGRADASHDQPADDGGLNSDDRDSYAAQPLWLRTLLSAAVFVWPFVYLSNQVVPRDGHYTGIDNDFGYAFYNYKVYLLDQLSRLRFPLWSPSEGAGFPFYSDPLPQTFYPFNLLLAAFYRCAGGYTEYDHQIFTIFAVSIFSLGLFHWLQQLPLQLRPVLFATLVMAVSFKVTETMRFPNSIHTAAWYPWILFAVTKIMRSQSAGQAARYGLLLTFFGVCMLTGGYPYFVYYSLFLFGPYLMVFLIPALRRRLWRQPLGSWRTSLAVLCAAGAAAFLLCAPYLSKMSQLMRETAKRGGGDFDYATEHEFRFIHTIGALIFPPSSQPEGWYYFGLIGVLLILLYLFDWRAWRRRGETEMLAAPWYQDRWIKIFFLVWIGAISYITYGRYSHLFLLLWKHMPLFANLRVWGRMNIILVPIIAWLLALAYTSFEDLLARKAGPHTRTARRWTPLAVLTACYLIALGAQLYLFKHQWYDFYWAKLGDFKHVRAKDVLFLVSGAAGFLVLAGLLIFAAAGRRFTRPALALTLAALVAVSALDMRPVGSQMWTYPAVCVERITRNVAEQNQNSFNVPRTDEEKLIPIVEPFNVGIMPNWYYKRYVQFLDQTNNELAARRQLLGVADGKKLYFSETLDHPTIQAFLDDAARFAVPLRVNSYTGDELTLDVHAPVPGYLSFIDNWDPDWEASIDGETVPIELLFGTFKSVRLPAGEHRVVFTYRPKFFSR